MDNKQKIYATAEQICAFHPDDPATHTVSPLLNDVLTVMSRKKLHRLRDIAVCFGMDYNKLGAALCILTGMKYSDMHDMLMHYRVQQLKTEHPEWGTDELADELGYADRSVLWNLMHRDAKKQEWARLMGYRRKMYEL